MDGMKKVLSLNKNFMIKDQKTKFKEPKRDIIQIHG